MSGGEVSDNSATLGDEVYVGSSYNGYFEISREGENDEIAKVGPGTTYLAGNAYITAHTLEGLSGIAVKNIVSEKRNRHDYRRVI